MGVVESFISFFGTTLMTVGDFTAVVAELTGSRIPPSFFRELIAADVARSLPPPGYKRNNRLNQIHLEAKNIIARKEKINK